MCVCVCVSCVCVCVHTHTRTHERLCVYIHTHARKTHTWQHTHTYTYMCVCVRVCVCVCPAPHFTTTDCALLSLLLSIICSLYYSLCSTGFTTHCNLLAIHSLYHSVTHSLCSTGFTTLFTTKGNNGDTEIQSRERRGISRTRYPASPSRSPPYIYLYTCIHTYIHTYIYLYTCIHTYIAPSPLDICVFMCIIHE